MREKLFSIIIPTCNRDQLLLSLLSSIKAQSIDVVKEIIVVSDSNKIPVIRVKDYDLKLITTGGGQGPAYARNLGAKEATGKYLVFIDDDIQLVPESLECMYDACCENRDSLVAVSGYIIPALSLQDNIYMQFAYGGAVHSKTVADEKRRYLHYCTSFALIDHVSFRRVGGFDERFKTPGYEDVEFAFRISGLDVPLIFLADAIGYHYKQMNREWFLQRCKNTGKQLRFFHQLQPEARQWYHKVIFNRVSRYVAAKILPYMLKRLNNIKKISSNSSTRWLQIIHGLALIATYK